MVRGPDYSSPALTVGILAGSWGWIYTYISILATVECKPYTKHIRRRTNALFPYLHVGFVVGGCSTGKQPDKWLRRSA